MKALTLTFLITFWVIFMAPSSHAQKSGGQHYEEPSRLPVLRKAFRQIRSDIRYHAGAIRDTASDIRHDVGASIRGKQRPEKYGYRPDNAHSSYHYEEPAPTPPLRSASKQRPSGEIAHRRERAVVSKPKIVAPRDLPKPSTRQSPPRSQPEPKQKPKPEPKPAPTKIEPTKNDPTPTAKKKTTPKPEQPKHESQPAPKPETEPSPKKTENKPAVGKIAYPDAKRSKRPGFHYSPFEPYELLDTQGIAPGELARDPGNGKIFRLPK